MIGWSHVRQALDWIEEECSTPLGEALLFWTIIFTNIFSACCALVVFYWELHP